MEPIHLSIEAGNIRIGLDLYPSSKTSRFLLSNLLLDKWRRGEFLLDASILHAHSFYFCVTKMEEQWVSFSFRIFYTHRTNNSIFFGYGFTQWTFHLTRCSPDDDAILKIVERMDPRLTDIDQSKHVIDWLKVLILFHSSYYPNLTGSTQRVPYVSDALILHWEDYRQALIELFQRAHSSSLYPCIQGWAADEGTFLIFHDPKTYLQTIIIVQDIGRKIDDSFVELYWQILIRKTD